MLLLARIKVPVPVFVKPPVPAIGPATVEIVEVGVLNVAPPLLMTTFRPGAMPTPATAAVPNDSAAVKRQIVGVRGGAELQVGGDGQGAGVENRAAGIRVGSVRQGQRAGIDHGQTPQAADDAGDREHVADGDVDRTAAAEDDVAGAVLLPLNVSDRLRAARGRGLKRGIFEVEWLDDTKLSWCRRNGRDSVAAQGDRGAWQCPK